MPSKRHGRRRRRHTRRRLIVIVVLAAALAGSLLVVGGRLHRHPAPRAKRPASWALSPARPIPGYLLIADRGNDRMLLVDGAKHVLWRYPVTNAGLPMPFRFDDDTFFGPRYDRIISNQEDQHTIQILSFPGGRVLWRYGHVNKKGSAPGYLNTPDDAYLLPNGLVTVADAYNCRVLFIASNHTITRQYGDSADCTHDPPAHLGAINGATPLADGGTLVSEINGSWIDDIGPDGRLRWTVRAPVTYPSDPQLLAPNRILLADYANPGHALIITRTGRVLWRYGPAKGPGRLDHPSLATRIAPGLIAVNDDYRDRVVLISIRTHRIVWQYGHTDRPGTANGFLNTPDGLDLLPTAAARHSRALRRLLAHPGRPAPKPTARAVVVAPASFHLPAPVEREVAVPDGNTILLAGGLDAAQQSTSGVFRLDPATGRLRFLGSLRQPFHDAAGAVLGSQLLVFGGGAASSTATVQSIDLRTRQARIVGSLPRPLSDLAAAKVGGDIYLVGGFDGKTPQAEIWRTSDGVHFALVARLPSGRRYAAVTAVGPLLVVAGGASTSGPTATVYVVDTRTGDVRLIGRLPRPAAGASALALGAKVYVTAAGTTTVINPVTGTVSPTGAVGAPEYGGASVAAGSGWILGGLRGDVATRQVTTVHAAR